MKHKEGDLISEAEMRELLNLPKDAIITLNNMNKFVKIIKGSYLLYSKLRNIQESNFSITLGRKIKLHAGLRDILDYQDFIHNISTNMKIEVGYYPQGNKSTIPIPFWTNTEFDGENVKIVKEMAYSTFRFKVLYVIVAEFKLKYNILLKFRDFSDKDYHSPIWLDGMQFPEIVFKRKNGLHHTVGHYQIKDCITNHYNIFVGKMHEPISRIIDSIPKK